MPLNYLPAPRRTTPPPQVPIPLPTYLTQPQFTYPPPRTYLSPHVPTYPPPRNVPTHSPPTYTPHHHLPAPTYHPPPQPAPTHTPELKYFNVFYVIGLLFLLFLDFLYFCYFFRCSDFVQVRVGIILHDDSSRFRYSTGYVFFCSVNFGRSIFSSQRNVSGIIKKMVQRRIKNEKHFFYFRFFRGVIED